MQLLPNSVIYSDKSLEDLQLKFVVRSRFGVKPLDLELHPTIKCHPNYSQKYVLLAKIDCIVSLLTSKGETDFSIKPDQNFSKGTGLFWTD